MIQQSNSPWASPIVLVKKKDGKFRFCVDYRKLNAATKRDAHPLPRIDDLLDSLQGSTMFSTLDLRSGYWQIGMSPEDREKTAFITPEGLWEFLRMPFGVSNGCATFQRAIKIVLSAVAKLDKSRWSCPALNIEHRTAFENVNQKGQYFCKY